MTESKLDNKRIIWTLIRGKGTKNPVIIGRKISQEWLTESVNTVEVFFKEDLLSSLRDLLNAAKLGKKNLPIMSLRASLVAGIDNLFHLERDLGLVVPFNSPSKELPAGMIMLAAGTEDRQELKDKVTQFLKRWTMDELEPWAVRHDFGELVQRVKKNINPKFVDLREMSRDLMSKNGSPDFQLVARIIAEKLIGEVLFDGLGPCELISNPESKNNYVELMTMPVRGAKSDDLFSMVAKLNVCSLPYSKDIYLSVSTMKRVWAKRVPGVNYQMPQKVTAYVMSPGRPAIMVSTDRRDGKWEFSEGYASVRKESNDALPVTLQDAIAMREFDSNLGWWAGLPELKTIFSRVSPQTVFEVDQTDLINTISPLLGSVVSPEPIEIKEVPLGRMQSKLRQEMLQLSDFGSAGDALISEAKSDDIDVDEEDFEGDKASPGKNRVESIQYYRDQNIKALKIEHGNNKPLLWVLGGTPMEQDIVKSSMTLLYGESVEVMMEPLPTGTHGLRADMEGQDLTARGRFDERVKKWSLATAKIREVSEKRPVIALICSARIFNNKSEDPVNYYAGIHALSSIGANVHHVLPIENPNDKASKQSFLHRTQSALLDVFLAHSGIVIGTQDFISKVLPETATPTAIYGIQAIRSKAKFRSGETGVTFILFSRLIIATGVTEIQIFYCSAKKNKSSSWMPLSKGLQWLGSQRQIHDGDEKWLKASFVDITKEALLEIQSSDPYAIVMIDWSTMAGLWKGIRDVDLKIGSGPKLDTIDLAANFPTMSFVRLRRGSDALTLRAAVKKTYEAWQEGDERSRTGEVYVDAYYSTKKSLVEVIHPELIDNKQSGHFIVTMGYAKTVQIPRGFSCYRSMPRMKKILGASGEFERGMLDPANLDASLPSSMELTVMHAPTTTDPKNIAMLVMGLRLGYAHYNDWTALPAPMFFRRKVEDYIIRFPDDEDTTIIDQSDVALEASNDVSSDQDILSAATSVVDNVAMNTFLEQALEIAENETNVAIDQDEEILLPTLGEPEPVVDDSSDLLSMAKKAKLVNLRDESKYVNLSRRIFKDDKTIRVRVDLPYWVKTNGIFGELTSTIRRNMARCWRSLRTFDLVSKNGVPQPEESKFLAWFENRLQIPQASLILATAWASLGGLNFIPFINLVEATYNRDNPLDGPINCLELNAEKLALLTKWADKSGHDELMAWLIFQVAQFPVGHWCESVLKNITIITGPLTEESLKYYLDVVYATDAAIAQKDYLSKFQQVIRRRPKPVIVQKSISPVALQINDASTSDVEAVLVDANESKIIEILDAKITLASTHVDVNDLVFTSVAAQARPKQPTLRVESEHKDPRVMLIKTKIVELIQLISPGSSSYDVELKSINENLAALNAIHLSEIEKNTIASKIHLQLVAIKDRCANLISQLEEMKDELELGIISYLEPEPEFLDAAEDDLNRIHVAIDDIQSFKRQIESIDAMTTPVSFAERTKRAKILNDAFVNISSITLDLKTMLMNCHCLQMTIVDPTPPDDVIDEVIEGEQKTLQHALVLNDIVHREIVPQTANLFDEIALPAKFVKVKQVQTSLPLTGIDSSSRFDTVLDGVDLNPSIKDPGTETPVSEKVMIPLLPEVDSAVISTEIEIADHIIEQEIARPESDIHKLVKSILSEVADVTDVKSKLIDSPLEVFLENNTFDDEDDIEVFDGGIIDSEAIEKSVEVLQHLVNKRLYGFSEIHVEGMRQSLMVLNKPDSQSHYIIIKALVLSLERMDCQFEFDPKLDKDLKDMLTEKALSSDELTDAATIALGVMAAGLSSMLFENGEDQWNIGHVIGSRLAGFPEITELIGHVDKIRQRGLVLTRETFISSHICDQTAVDKELRRYSDRANNWKNDSNIYTGWSHRGYRALHEEMFSHKGSIGNCLNLIAKGDVKKLHGTFEELRKKFEKPATTVDEMYRKIGERAKPDGPFRERAIENVIATKKFIEEYLDLAKRRDNPNIELAKSTQTFLVELNVSLTKAKFEIEKFKTPNHLSTLYRDAAASALGCAIRLFDNDRAAHCIPQKKQKLLIPLPMNFDLMPCIEPIDQRTPELCQPTDILRETAWWAKEVMSIEHFEDDIDQNLLEAMKEHVASQRFLPAFIIEPMLPSKMLANVESVRQTYERKKVAFIAELQESRQRVTHAMTLDALPKNEAPEMLRTIEEILSSLNMEKSIGFPDGGSATYPDFPQAKASLRHNVKMPLDARLNEATSRLDLKLQECEKKWGATITKDIVRIREMLTDNNASNLRAAHDAIAMLSQSGKLPKKVGVFTDVATEYETFIQKLHLDIGSHKIPLDSLSERLLAPKKEGEPAWLASLSETQRNEGIELIKSWMVLFQSSKLDLVNNVKPLEHVFELLGIRQPINTNPESGRLNRLRFSLPERTFTFPSAAESDLFIPPALGSWATFIQGFVVFGAPTDNELRQVMQEVGGTPTVTLAHTRLSMQKRIKISGSSPVLLLDDDLIAYLALHPEDRFQSFISIALISFSTNPYDDYNSRPVPSEMFFGRQSELNKLRDVKSMAVLYGGRRLGKSSLLSQIDQEMSNTPGSTAVYISMETVNSSGSHIISGWEFIARNLAQRDIIPYFQPSVSRNWKSLSQWVGQQLIEQKKFKSIYLLIDEADELIGCELKLQREDIGFVRSLQQMIDDVQHAVQIRYVIAGLHNMTRMTTEENSVFGKADPIALGPFNTPDDIHRGIRLITKPLAAMGFLFGKGDEDLPLRIMSVCFFYPAFIQLYCKRLVDRLQNNRQDSKPPLFIKADDLDAVERDPALLIELRRKFELNLNLDKRYKAIALFLAEVYYSEIVNGHYQGLTTKEISDYCESFATTHFMHTGPGVYEALLDEMCKLNVLERNGTRYVLRNPNIAMMMGDRDRVSTQIEELSKETPEYSRNHGERRIMMVNEGGNARQLFPFPVAWTRRYLDPSDGELLIVTGNELSGMNDLILTTQSDWKIGHDGWLCCIQGNGVTLGQEYLKKARQKSNEKNPRFVIIRPNAWSIKDIPELIALAAKGARLGIRFIALATTERALDLANAMDAGSFAEQESQCQIVPVPNWTEDAIYFMLHENIEVADNSNAITAIIDATCGYGKEVSALCINSLTVADALNAKDKKKVSFAPSLDEFYKKLAIPQLLSKEERHQMEQFLLSIDGESKSSSGVDEMRELLQISPGKMAFARWMGLLQDGPGGTWKLPKLYSELIK